MFRIILTTLLISASLIKGEEDIDIKTNSSNPIEGMPVAISCDFINIPDVDMLLWKNINNRLKTKLTCKKEICQGVEGYQLSRTGNKITLVIEHVDKLANKWECANIGNTYSKIIELNITAQPNLSLTISKENSHFNIKTSCSSVPMKVSCTYEGESIQVIDLKSMKCSNPVFSYLTGIVKPTSSGELVCQVQQKNNTFVQRYSSGSNVWIIIGAVGGTVAFVIITIIVLFRYKDKIKEKNRCCYASVPSIDH